MFGAEFAISKVTLDLLIWQIYCVSAALVKVVNSATRAKSAMVAATAQVVAHLLQ